MQVRSLSLAVALASSGCPTSGEEPPPPGPPALEWAVEGSVSPDAVNFGAVEVGYDGAVDLVLSNTGGTPLRSLWVDASKHPALTLAPSAPPRFLDAGATTSVRLHYRPTEDAALEEVLWIRSDDPANEEVEVAIVGDGLGPVASLRVVEGPGDVVVGCEAPAQLVLSNVGRGGEVTNRGVEIVGDDRGAFSSLRPANETWILAPGDEAAFGVRFLPGRLGAHAATVTADEPGDASDAAVEIGGEGLPGPTTTDAFVQSAGSRADLLFVVDDSPGMDHTALLAAAVDLVDALDGHGMDWHVGVLTTDVAELGTLRGPPAWVHAGHADPVAALRDAFDVGNEGSEIEQGLHQALLALTPPRIDGVNAGFVRDDSLLHLVFVSDEDDLSQAAANWAPAEYADFFTTRKADPADVVVSDITGGPAGCPDASAAPAYAEVTQLVGGASWSFCDPSWAPAMDGIAGASRRRARRFALSVPAIPGTVETSVDGAPVATSYDPDHGEVVFDPGAAPAPDAEIVVTYAAVGCL